MKPSPFSPSKASGGEAGLVWVLEDSPLEAEMVRRALSQGRGSKVEIFTDSPGVLERLANGARPDLLVLDCQLPTLTGIEVCQFIRQSFDEMELPILMLTVESHRNDLLEGLNAGANDYLTKPYDVAELQARVATLIRTRHLQRARTRRTRDLALTAEIGTMLTRGRESAAQLCATAIGQHLEASLVAIWTSDEGGEMELAGHFGAVDPRHVRSLRDTGDGHQPTVRYDAEADACVFDPAWRSGASRTFLELPLQGESSVIGTLTLAAQRRLDAEDMEALAPLADLIALGLQRMRVERERAGLLEREQRARAEAEAANRGKDEFLAVLSHELRGPLNAIAGWIQLLRAGEVAPDRLDRALETIERNTHAQAQLVEDLLDVSRIVSGKLTIDNDLVDLAGAVEEVVESFRPVAAEKGLALVAAVEPVGDVRGEATRIRQVVTNLVGNAIKFTPAGGRIAVTLRREGGSALVRVEDTGQGIDAAFLPHVFERFRQADGSTTRRHGGLGLGLAIVHHLTALHRGRVTVESEGRGRGSAFSVHLPLAFEAPTEPVSAVRGAPLAADLGLRVVIVDDDDEARDLLTAILTSRGIDVRAAGSAPEALVTIRETLPDVVVTDIGMPGTDGFDLLRLVRGLPPSQGGRIPVIALTAYASSSDRAAGAKAGFDRYLTKPPDLETLIEAVTSVGARARQLA